MTKSIKSRLSPSENFEIGDDKDLSHSTENFDLANDPDYLKFLDHYQKGEFTECTRLLETLDVKYPGNPELQKIWDDFNMRRSVNNMTSAIRKGETLAKSKVTAKLILFAVVGIITIGAVFFAASLLFLKGTSVEEAESEISQLSVLYKQADQLLEGGRPELALEIIEKIKAIDPQDQKLPDLIDRTDALLEFEDEYHRALVLINQGKQNEALVLLKQLESENSGMWDISQRIASIENVNRIAEYKEEGNAAYMNEEWDKVITAYEGAMALDTSLNDPLMIEQLLYAYLNQIITLLESDTNAIEDIEVAEQYYRKATALIPQNKNFFNQRGNLEEVSSNLLELKYTQVAKAGLADKNQTISTISRAVSYMGKALNLNPNNAALQEELTNARIYQIAFQNFLDMDWAQAVTRLEKVLAADKNYAGGNASALLYESYYALGKQYYNASIYTDARTYLEQAEILAWADGDNMLKLFQVQVLLGSSIGRLDDFKTAISYYQYALRAIQAQMKLGTNPGLLTKYSKANSLASYGKYQEAFEIFQELFEEIDVVYTTSEVEIAPGVCLALFASDNLSTLDAVLKANNLPKNMSISFGRTLSVPSIQR